MEIPTREGLHEGSEWWHELPKNVKEKVLAWLPAERLCRYCVVCKQWNALISSTKFITDDWLAAPPNKNPWLLLFINWESKSELLNSMAYCLFTKTWKRLSLAFLKNRYDDVRVEASAAGLFLICTFGYLNYGFVSRHIVCNPLTGKWIELPTIEGGAIWGSTMIAEKDRRHNKETYKVIAMESSDRENRVEIYDSSLKSWSTVGRLPQNIKLVTTRRIVASRDFLYVNGKDENSSKLGIVAFSIQNGTSLFAPLPFQDVAPLPFQDVDNNTVMFACESRVLLGSCISGSDEIIISELKNSQSIVQFTEIARIPLTILHPDGRDGVFHFRSFMLDFEGMRDLVFIRDIRGNEVLVYNLNQFTGTWLSRCPMPPLLKNWYDTPGSTVFQPRPDKGVE